MAARENQGYVIFIIVVTLLMVIFGLLAFLGMSKSNELSSLKDAADKDLEFQKKLVEAYELKASILEAYVGMQGSVTEVQGSIDRIQSLGAGLEQNAQSQISEITTQVTNIKAEYEKDMRSLISSGEGAEDLTYRGLTKNLTNVLGKKHNELNIFRNDKRRLVAQTQAQLEAKTKTVEEVQKALATLKTQFETATGDYRKQEDTLQAALDTITGENQKVNNRLENIVQTAAAEKKRLEEGLAKTDALNAAMKRKIDVYEKESFTLADGKITKVNGNTVFVNLGSRDGLRANRTFSVYDRSTFDFEKGENKAAIIITRIIGDHEAEGIVTFEDTKIPILTGDHILTPVWDPGYEVPIALAGNFDIDGDGLAEENDRQRLIQLIRQNGGRVVAWHNQEGAIQGKVDSNVRFLVIGEVPQRGLDVSLELFDAVKTLKQQAQNNTVEIISTTKLLNWMGQHARPRVEFLDGRSAPSEFQKRLPTVETLKSSDR